MIPVGWLILSFLIGFLGRDRLLGFWGSFLISLFLSPLVGALSVAITRESHRRA